MAIPLCVDCWHYRRVETEDSVYPMCVRADYTSFAYGGGILTLSAMTDTEKWGWYVGQGGDMFDEGPYCTRDDAIAEGRDLYDGESFSIVEAIKHGDDGEIKLAKYFDAERIIGNSTFYDLQGPYGEDITGHVTETQWEDLTNKIRKIVDELQRMCALLLHCGPDGVLGEGAQ